MGIFYIYKKTPVRMMAVAKGMDSGIKNEFGNIERYREPYTVEAASARDALALFFMNEQKARNEKDCFCASENADFAREYNSLVDYSNDLEERW